jgi:hypothetical protein
MTNRLYTIASFVMLTVTTACASAWPAQRIGIVAGTATGDSALDGGYRWTTLDGNAAPVEFPANSGRRLVYGTLDLHNAMSARSGSGGTYSIRFTEQPMNDTVRTSGNDGQFVLRGDTLLFRPDGQNAPVVFRYAWRPNGELALTDGARHVWVYVRR